MVRMAQIPEISQSVQISEASRQIYYREVHRNIYLLDHRDHIDIYRIRHQ